MELRLVQDDPSPGTALAAVEGTIERGSESRRGARMGGGGARMRDERAMNDLRHEVLGDRNEVLVRSLALGGVTHRDRI
jgi:hypothetical protein